MSISIGRKLFAALMIWGLIPSMVTVAKAENQKSVCTADINQYGYSSNCNCENDKRYSGVTGKCMDLTVAQKRVLFQKILSNFTASIVRDKDEIKSVKKLHNHMQILMSKMDGLVEIYSVDLQLIKDLKHSLVQNQFDLEICQYEPNCDHKPLLGDLSILTSKLQKLLYLSNTINND